MSEHNEEQEEKGSKFKINRRLILWIIITILAAAVVYVVFFKDAASMQAINPSGMVGGC